MGRIPLVRLELELRGFKALFLLLFYALGSLWDFLDHTLDAIDGYRRKIDGVIGGAMDEYVRLEAKWKDVEVPCGAAADRIAIALVDKKKVIITEKSVRSDLMLEDAEGTECLPNDVIFEQITLMSAKTTAWNEFSSTIASVIILLATN
ncbi:hypothetical protein Tco_0828584 [Tanacetum coccineum]